MGRSLKGVVVIVVLASLCLFPMVSWPAPSKGGTAEQFYRGKTLSIFTGSAGGASDIVTRALVPFLEKEIGVTAVVKNQPGGGTLQTENLAYKAKPDGLTLLSMEPNSVALSNWFNEPGAVFDVAKFNWLAQLAFEPTVFIASPQKGYQSMKDLQQAKGLKFGTAAPLSWYGPANMMLAWILNLDAKVISGLKGTGQIILSLQKGELDGEAVAETVAQQYGKAGQVKPLFVFYGESRVFSNLPVLIKEVKLTKEQEKMMQVLAPISKALSTSPGVPQERVNYLRNALKKICEDKNTQQAVVEKGGFAGWYGFVSGEEVQRQMAQPQLGQEVKRILENLMEKYMR